MQDQKREVPTKLAIPPLAESPDAMGWIYVVPHWLARLLAEGWIHSQCLPNDCEAGERCKNSGHNHPITPVSMVGIHCLSNGPVFRLIARSWSSFYTELYVLIDCFLSGKPISANLLSFYLAGTK